jgi:hypothetical protein
MWSRLAHENAHKADDMEAERATLREALTKARTFTEMVLECDKYGCENGPYDCLHGQASRHLDELAALVSGEDA